jgi:2-C-methyl-D-erythritol 2,4-cyclodiphosphate synthase
MLIGGIEVSREKGLLGHSDGDVLLHAVADAVLGALAKGDIGHFFPDTDNSIKGISSVKIIEKAAGLMREEGFKLGNLDCVVVAEEPKIGPYRERIAEFISSLFFSEACNVNIKAKTKEGTGEVGEGLAIEAYASVMLVDL